MPNDMKLIIESFRSNMNEDTMIDKVTDLFSSPNALPDESRMQLILGNYAEGTYGAFAQSHQILSILKQKNIKIKTETITAAFEALAGAKGDGSTIGKISTTVGYTLAVAGALSVLKGALAVGAGVAGVALAAKALANAYKGDPTAVERQPALAAFGLDHEYLELLDDKVEDEFLKYYEKHFLQMVQQKPNKRMTNINQVAYYYFRKNFNKRTVVGAPNVKQLN